MTDTNIQEKRLAKKMLSAFLQDDNAQLEHYFYEMGRLTKQETLAFVREIIIKYPSEFILEAETEDEANSIKSEILQKLGKGK